jgi:Ca-activated chloride channel homolog
LRIGEIGLSSTHPMRHLAIAFAFTLLSIFPQGQNPPVTRPERNEDQGSTIRVDTDLVMIDVKVTDRGNGSAVTGLRAEDFAVYEDGKQQKIALFSQNTVPLNVALVLDTSGSTQGEVGLMRQAARRFLDELRPKDRVALVAFSQDIRLLAEMTADRQTIEAGLDEITAGNGTSFYDAMVVTLNDVFKRVEGRKAIVVLSDGVDSFGHYAYPHLLSVAESGAASFYVLEMNTLAFTLERLLLDCGNPRHFKLSRKQLKKYGEQFEKDSLWWVTSEYCDLTVEQKRKVTQRLYEVAHEELEELSSRTGGLTYPVQELKDLPKVYAKIAAELRTQYSLGYYPANERHDGQWRSLKVDVNAKGLTARAKPGYRAPRD